MEAPNFRDSDCCHVCMFLQTTHSCGCCPEEYDCTLYDADIGDGEGICDTFENSNYDISKLGKPLKP